MCDRKLFLALAIICIAFEPAVNASADPKICAGNLEDPVTAEPIAVVPLVSLLSNASHFNDCLVHTVGILGMNQQRIFMSSEHLKLDLALNGIGLVAGSKDLDLASYAGKWIFVRGRFLQTGGVSVGVIKDIDRVVPAVPLRENP